MQAVHADPVSALITQLFTVVRSNMPVTDNAQLPVNVAEYSAEIPLRRIAHIAAALALFLGVTSLLVAAFSMHSAARLEGGIAPLPLPSRLGFCLAALAIMTLTTYESGGKLRTWAARAMAVTVMLIGLFDVADTAVQTRTFLTVAGVSVLCLSAQKTWIRSLAQYGAVIIGYAAMTAICTFLYGLEFVVALGYSSGLTLRAALMFFCIAVALLLASRPARPSTVFLAPGSGDPVWSRLLLLSWLLVPFLGVLAGFGPQFGTDLTNLIFAFTLIVPPGIWAVAAGLAYRDRGRINESARAE